MIIKYVPHLLINVLKVKNKNIPRKTNLRRKNMTKKELEKVLNDKDFEQIQIYFEHRSINVLIYKVKNKYSVVSYHICYPAETLLKLNYKTIKGIFKSWLLRNLFKEENLKKAIINFTF